MTPSPKAASTPRRRVFTHVPFAFAAVFTAVTMGVPQGQAADITWDGATGPFTTGTNWSGDVVPGTLDNAIIGNGGNAQIQIGDAVSVNRLIIDNGTVTQTGGSTTTVKHGDYTAPGDYAIGSTSGQTGVYNVSGGTVNGGRVRIGYSGGTGVMTFGNNSVYNGVAGVDTWVGNGAGSVGTLSITDTAQWKIDDDWFVVGRSGGTGTLNMSGTTVLSLSNGGPNIVFGDGQDSHATANIGGSATVYTTGGEIWVGNGGATGTLNLSGNAVMTAQNHWIAVGRRADGRGGNGTAIISGNAQLKKEGGAADRHIVIADGEGSVGVMTVKDSGKVSTNQRLMVGQGGSAQGTLNVQDNATVDVAGEFWIGQNAHGTVNLQGGTINVNNWFAVGRDGALGAASGTLNISGGTLNKNGAGQFVVNGATSVVTQTGGALNVNSGETWISEFNGRSATWTASGGTASLGPITRIGVSGNATMTISGTANYTNQTVYIGSNATSTGTLNLNGGTFTANLIEEGAGNGFINFNGGVLRAGASNANFLADFEAGDLNVQAGGLIFDTDGFDNAITVSLSGIGGLTKTGEGTLTLADAQAYTGNTSILNGVLSIDSIYLADTSNVLISGDAVLHLGTGGQSDLINALIVNGVMQAAGTYGSIGSGAQYEVSYLTGDGFLVTAVPEPEHYALGVGLLLGTLVLLRRRQALAAQS